MMDAEQIDMFTSLPTRRAVAGPTTAPLLRSRAQVPKLGSPSPSLSSALSGLPRRVSSRCLEGKMLHRRTRDTARMARQSHNNTPSEASFLPPPHCLRQLPRTDAEPFNGGLDHPRKTIPTLGWSALAMCLTKIQNCTPILRRARGCKRDALSWLLELL
jgi:hypothetical protein